MTLQDLHKTYKQGLKALDEIHVLLPQILEERKMTRTELAEKLGIDLSYMSRVVAGKKKLSEEKIDQLVEILA